MEHELDIRAVKEDLLSIYRRFYVEPNDEDNKRNAQRIYFEYMNLSFFVDRGIGFAIYCLVDILGARPITKEQVMKIIENLELAKVDN